MKALFLMMLLFFSTAQAGGDYPGALYLVGDQPKGVILLHGRGKYPDWKVVDPVRKGVWDVLKYHSLSMQMPNEDKPWKEYASDFPQAYAEIENGIAFLQAEGVETIYLLGHSMGARMASAFMVEHPDAPIKGLILIGCRNNGGYPLSCYRTVKNVEVPVLDVWGNASEKDKQAGAERTELVSDRYQQVVVEKANHTFDGWEDELLEAVFEWLEAQ